MRKLNLIILAFFFSLNFVKAEVTTIPRTEDDLGVNKDIVITESNKDNVLKFKYILEASGKKVTVRLERGADIDAACGQLASKAK